MNASDPTGLMPGEEYGQLAVDYWAERWVDPQNAWYDRAGSAVMGVLAATWAGGNSDTTALVLAGGWISAPYLAAMGPLVGSPASQKCLEGVGDAVPAVSAGPAVDIAAGRSAIEAAQANPQSGFHITKIVLGDSRWLAADGWQKMQQIVNGYVVHYVYNPLTGVAADFKVVSGPK